MATPWELAVQETYSGLRATSIAAGNRNRVDGGVEMDGFSWPCTLKPDGKLCFPDVIAFKLEATGQRFLVACGRDSNGRLCNELPFEFGHPAPRSGFVEVSKHTKVCGGYYRKAGFPPATNNRVIKFIGGWRGGDDDPIEVERRLVRARNQAIASGLHTQQAPGGLASPRHRCWDAYSQMMEVEYHIESTSEYAFSSGRSPRDITNTSTVHWEIVGARTAAYSSLSLKEVKTALRRLRNFEQPWDSGVRGTGKLGAKTTQDYIDAILRSVGSLRGSFVLSVSKWSPRWVEAIEAFDGKYKPEVVVSSAEVKTYEVVFPVEISGPEDRLRACGVLGRSATAALTKWGVVTYTSTEQDVWMITKGWQEVAVIREDGWWASYSDDHFLCAPTAASFTDDKDTLGAWWPRRFTGERGKDFLRRQPATRAAAQTVLLVATRNQGLPALPVELWLIVLSFTRAHEIGPAPKIIEDTKTWGVKEGVYHPTGEVHEGKPKFKKMEWVVSWQGALAVEPALPLGWKLCERGGGVFVEELEDVCNAKTVGIQVGQQVGEVGGVSMYEKGKADVLKAIQAADYGGTVRIVLLGKKRTVAGVPMRDYHIQFYAGWGKAVITNAAGPINGLYTATLGGERMNYVKRSSIDGGPWHFLNLQPTDATLWFLPKAPLPMALSVRDLRPAKPLTSDPRHGDPRLRDQALMWQTLVTHRRAALKDPEDY